MTSPYLNLPRRSVDEVLRDRNSTEAMRMTEADPFALGGVLPKDDEEDPIFALIDEHEQAVAAWSAENAKDEHSEETERLLRAEGAVYDRVLACVPETIAGVIALLRWAAEHTDLDLVFDSTLTALEAIRDREGADDAESP